MDISIRLLLWLRNLAEYIRTRHCVTEKGQAIMTSDACVLLCCSFFFFFTNYPMSQVFLSVFRSFCLCDCECVTVCVLSDYVCSLCWPAEKFSKAVHVVLLCNILFNCVALGVDDCLAVGTEVNKLMRASAFCSCQHLI